MKKIPQYLEEDFTVDTPLLIGSRQTRMGILPAGIYRRAELCKGFYLVCEEMIKAISLPMTNKEKRVWDKMMALLIRAEKLRD